MEIPTAKIFTPKTEPTSSFTVTTGGKTYSMVLLSDYEKLRAEYTKLLETPQNEREQAIRDHYEGKLYVKQRELESVRNTNKILTSTIKEVYEEVRIHIDE